MSFTRTPTCSTEIESRWKLDCGAVFKSICFLRTHPVFCRSNLELASGVRNRKKPTFLQTSSANSFSVFSLGVKNKGNEEDADVGVYQLCIFFFIVFYFHRAEGGRIRSIPIYSMGCDSLFEFYCKLFPKCH